MTTVKAGVEYKIEYDDKSFLLDEKKFNLLTYINETESITEAAKRCSISYRTALNYISKIESSLELSLVNTSKGGSGGGGKTTLSNEGLQILKECKKIKAIIELHNEANEIEAKVIEIDDEKNIMTLKMNNILVTIKAKPQYIVGDKILALISYDNILVMLENHKTSIKNIFKGKITEMQLKNNKIRVKIDIGIELYADIGVSAANNLEFNLGKEIYVGFKSSSVGTLKL